MPHHTKNIPTVMIFLVISFTLKLSWLLPLLGVWMGLFFSFFGLKAGGFFCWNICYVVLVGLTGCWIFCCCFTLKCFYVHSFSSFSSCILKLSSFVGFKSCHKNVHAIVFFSSVFVIVLNTKYTWFESNSSSNNNSNNISRK